MKFDFDKYKGKYVMHCKTDEEAEEFCKVMHEAGRKWRRGDCKGETVYYFNEGMYGEWSDFKGETVYYFNEGMSGHIQEAQDYTILEWSDFRRSKEPSQSKSHKRKFVVDRQRGFKTIYINGVTIAVPVETPIGIAIKNPDDEYDEERGRSLAYYRMGVQE